MGRQSVAATLAGPQNASQRLDSSRSAPKTPPTGRARHLPPADGRSKRGSDFNRHDGVRFQPALTPLSKEHCGCLTHPSASLPQRRAAAPRSSGSRLGSPTAPTPPDRRPPGWVATLRVLARDTASAHEYRPAVPARRRLGFQGPAGAYRQRYTLGASSCPASWSAPESPLVRRGNRQPATQGRALASRSRRRFADARHALPAPWAPGGR